MSKELGEIAEVRLPLPEDEQFPVSWIPRLGSQGSGLEGSGGHPERLRRLVVKFSHLSPLLFSILGKSSGENTIKTARVNSGPIACTAVISSATTLHLSI